MYALGQVNVNGVFLSGQGVAAVVSQIREFFARIESVTYRRWKRRETAFTRRAIKKIRHITQLRGTLL